MWVNYTWPHLIAYSKLDSKKFFFPSKCKKKKLNRVTHTYNPTTWKAKQEDSFKFRASMYYIVSARTPSVHNKILYEKKKKERKREERTKV